MYNEEAKNKLKAILSFKGVIGEEAFEAEVRNINNAIPEGMKATMPEDVYERANAFVDKYYEIKGSTAPGITAPVQAPVVSSAPTISSEMLRRGSRVLAENAESKKTRAAKTRISKVILDKPKPSTYLQASTKIIPICDLDRLTKYEKMLVDTEENRKNFQTIKDAVIAKTALPIFINDASQRVVGYEITTPSGDAGNPTMVSKLLSQRRLIGFLLTELQGYIPTDEKTGLSARIALAKSNKNQAANTTAQPSDARVRVPGLSEAKKNPSLIDTATVVDGKKTKNGRLRILPTFEIEEQKIVEQKTVTKKRTIRLGGEAVVPEFMPKDETYKAAELVKIPGQGLDKSGMRKATEDSTKLLAVIIDAAIDNPLNGVISEFGVSDIINKVAEEKLQSSVPTL